jgi:hypothetical protein
MVYILYDDLTRHNQHRTNRGFILDSRSFESGRPDPDKSPDVYVKRLDSFDAGIHCIVHQFL